MNEKRKAARGKPLTVKSRTASDGEVFRWRGGILKVIAFEGVTRNKGRTGRKGGKEKRGQKTESMMKKKSRQPAIRMKRRGGGVKLTNTAGAETGSRGGKKSRTSDSA